LVQFFHVQFWSPYMEESVFGDLSLLLHQPVLQNVILSTTSNTPMYLTIQHTMIFFIDTMCLQYVAIEHFTIFYRGWMYLRHMY